MLRMCSLSGSAQETEVLLKRDYFPETKYIREDFLIPSLRSKLNKDNYPHYKELGIK